MLSSSSVTRRLFVRCCSSRFYSTSRPSVKVYLHDGDVAPIVQFEPGVSIVQVRDYFNVRGGGLKHKGDTDNVVLKDKPTGFENGDYVLFGFQGNTPSVHLHHQQQQQQLQLQYLHHQLLQLRSPSPNASAEPVPPPTLYHSPPPPPQNFNHPPTMNAQHYSHVNVNESQPQYAPPPPPTPPPQQKSNASSGAKASLAQELGIDTSELEMFPWLVDETNNPKPF